MTLSLPLATLVLVLASRSALASQAYLHTPNTETLSTGNSNDRAELENITKTISVEKKLHGRFIHVTVSGVSLRCR